MVPDRASPKAAIAYTSGDFAFNPVCGGRRERTLAPPKVPIGSANLYIVNHFAQEQEERAIARFRGGREKEYSEIIAECHKALKHIEWEYERREFNFEEVEELEGDVDKIKRWQAEVVKRDFWEAAMRGDVEERIKEVEEKIAVFTQKTYEETARLPGEDAGPDGNPPVARSGGVRSTRPIAPGPL